MFIAPKVGGTEDICPESKALFNMNVRVQRIGGTASYATASLHQVKTWPLAIILPKKSWSSPVRNSGLNGRSQAARICRFSSTLPARPLFQSITKPVG